MQQQSSTSRALYCSWIYSLSTSMQSTSKILGAGLVVILRLIHKGSTTQAHAKGVLGIKSINLNYCWPILLHPGLPRRSNDLQCFLFDRWNPQFRSCPSYREPRVLQATVYQQNVQFLLWISSKIILAICVDFWWAIIERFFDGHG